MSRLQDKAFSVIELTIAMFIILFLAAISALYFSGHSGKTRAFISECYMINLYKALEAYKDANGVYPENLTSLPREAPRYIGFVYCSTSGTNSENNGYIYLCDNISKNAYEITATPIRTDNGALSCWQISTGGKLMKKPFSQSQGACQGYWEASY